MDDKIKLTYTLRDVNNNNIMNERIVASINGKAYNLTTDKNGIATQVYTPTSGGNLTIVTAYKGNII